MVQDREVQLATLKAVAALAEQMTGKRMIISVHTDDGQTLNVYGSGVRWEPAILEAVEDHPVCR